MTRTVAGGGYVEVVSGEAAERPSLHGAEVLLVAGEWTLEWQPDHARYAVYNDQHGYAEPLPGLSREQAEAVLVSYATDPALAALALWQDKDQHARTLHFAVMSAAPYRTLAEVQAAEGVLDHADQLARSYYDAWLTARRAIWRAGQPQG